MARYKTYVYDCDATLCPVKDVIATDDMPPIGYSGKVSFNSGSDGRSNVEWYACSADHVASAIETALKLQSRADWE